LTDELRFGIDFQKSQRNNQTFSTVRRTKIKFREKTSVHKTEEAVKEVGRKTENERKEMQINCILKKIKR